MDALSRAVAATEERDRVGKRRGELLHVGRPARSPRPRKEHADQHGERLRGASRAQGWPVGNPARAVSDWLLHEVDGRSYRRPNRRMERTRPLGDGEHARPVPYGDRQGNDEQGHPLPAAPESPRSVTATRPWQLRIASELDAADARAVALVTGLPL